MRAWQGTSFSHPVPSYIPSWNRRPGWKFLGCGRHGCSEKSAPRVRAAWPDARALHTQAMLHFSTHSFLAWVATAIAVVESQWRVPWRMVSYRALSSDTSDLPLWVGCLWWPFRNVTHGNFTRDSCHGPLAKCMQLSFAQERQHLSKRGPKTGIRL